VGMAIQQIKYARIPNPKMIVTSKKTIRIRVGSILKNSPKPEQTPASFFVSATRYNLFKFPPLFVRFKQTQQSTDLFLDHRMHQPGDKISKRS
jgi:hypothetical protein